MQENLLAHKITIEQNKAGIPNFLPWSPNIYDCNQATAPKDEIVR
jgi:hypothetical protein